MKGEMIMKKNTTKPAENQEMNQEKTKDDGLYTIVERYVNFCNQAHLNSGRIKWNDRYLNCWFPY